MALPFEHTRANYPVLSHTLVPARRERIVRFVDAYGEMASVVSEHGRAKASEAQEALVALLDAWVVEDFEAQQPRPLSEESAASLKSAFQLALQHTEVLNDDDEDERRHRSVVEARLRSAIENLEPLPANAVRRLRRSARRLHRLVELEGPAVILANEAVLLAMALVAWKTRPDAGPTPISWTRGCDGLLWHGLRMCIALEDDASIRDLGLGPRQDLWTRLDISVDACDRALQAQEPLEVQIPAIATYPFVPRDRVHALGAAFPTVRDHGEITSPIGWASGDAVAELADAYREIGEEEVADRVAVHEAVIGCIEWMDYEGDGRRDWLADDDFV